MRVGWEASGPLVHVDSKNGAEEIFCNELAVIEVVASAAFVAKRDIKVSVGTEMNVAAIMIIRLVQLGNERRLGVRQSRVRIGRRDLEPRKAVIIAEAGGGCRHHRAKHVEVSVGLVARMKRQTQQASFPEWFYPIPDIQEESFGGVGEICNDLNPPGLLHDEQPVGFAGWTCYGDRLIEKKSRERVDGRVFERLGRKCQSGVGFTTQPRCQKRLSEKSQSQAGGNQPGKPPAFRMNCHNIGSSASEHYQNTGLRQRWLEFLVGVSWRQSSIRDR